MCSLQESIDSYNELLQSDAELKDGILKIAPVQAETLSQHFIANNPSLSIFEKHRFEKLVNNL